MQTVAFTRMADGTREEYQFLEKLEEEYVQALPQRLMEALQRLEHSFSGRQNPESFRDCTASRPLIPS